MQKRKDESKLGRHVALISNDHADLNRCHDHIKFQKQSKFQCYPVLQVREGIRDEESEFETGGRRYCRIDTF